MTMVMIVIVAMRAVHVTVLQLFRSRFADGDDFHIKLQVLTSQHVVAINHNVVVFNFSDFYWYRTLIGFRRTHANLQFINAMKTFYGTVFVTRKRRCAEASIAPTSWHQRFPAIQIGAGRK